MFGLIDAFKEGMDEAMRKDPQAIDTKLAQPRETNAEFARGYLKSVMKVLFYAVAWVLPWTVVAIIVAGG